MLQHPVPEKFLVHIGDITVSFALLESTIQSLIGSFIAEHQRIGQIITTELAFRNLRALTISLYKERHGEDTDFGILRELMKRAADLEEKRNQITHSVWGAGDTADTVLERHKIYQVLPDEEAARDGDIRVIDESGEAYLYPASSFVVIEVPQEVERAILHAS